MRRVSISRSAFKLFALAVFVFLCCFVVFVLLPISAHGRAKDRLQETSYAVVMDCGSSGSRVYLYKWPHAVGQGGLLRIDEVLDEAGRPLVKKIEPGLSTCQNDPLTAFDYLRPLLQFAAASIPVSHHPDTQLFILATAGLRLVPFGPREAILEGLRTQVPLHYPFLLPKDNVMVISGRDEGLFSWLALNYLLGRLQDGEAPTAGTVGSLDMGGGSMQVAFQVDNEEEVADDRLSVVDVGCGDSPRHKYTLYAATYLGLGANQARERYLQASLPTTADPRGRGGNSTGAGPVGLTPSKLWDPCSPVDMHEHLTTPGGGFTFTLHGSGDFLSCKRALMPLLNGPTANCSRPCPDRLVPPPINSSMDFYGFSEFFYSMEDVLGMGGAYSKSDFESAAIMFCRHKWSTLEGWYRQNLYPKADENRFRTQCFKSAWMSVVLHQGLGFPDNASHMTSADQLGGRSLQWALGALVHHTRCLPLRYAKQERDSPHSHFLSLWPTLGLSQGTFQVLMVVAVLCVLLMGYCYFRMLKTGRLSSSMLGTGSLANIVRNTSFVGRV